LQKNYPTLLKAFSQYLQNFPNAHLIILGSGPDETYLKKLTHTLKIDQCVHFIGNTPQVADWMSLFDIFVLSSRYEGFGLVLVEAMQVGLPIIAANNSAIPEVLGEDYLGLYPTYDSEILAHRLIQFSTLEVQEESRMILRERLNQFDPILMEKRIDSVYLQAIQRL
jgi:glycosyltransferase involved in cell wall biosynthesis